MLRVGELLILIIKVNKLSLSFSPMQKTSNYMGGAGSRGPPSDDEEYTIPPFEQWRHNKSTVRARHQLITMPYKRNCDYCRIVKNSTQKTSISVKHVNSNFVLLKATITLRSGILPNVITTDDTLS